MKIIKYLWIGGTGLQERHIWFGLCINEQCYVVKMSNFIRSAILESIHVILSSFKTSFNVYELWIDFCTNKISH